MSGHLKDPGGNWSIVWSLISLVIPVLAPGPISVFSFFSPQILALVQSLEQVSLYAEPVQSLSDVSDQLSHAALLTQRLHHRVQLLEELYGRVREAQILTVILSAAACAETKHMNTVCVVFFWWCCEHQEEKSGQPFIHTLGWQHFTHITVCLLFVEQKSD